MKTTRIKTFVGVIGLALASSMPHLQGQPPAPGYCDAPYSGAPINTVPGRYYATPLSGKVYLSFDAGVALQQDITMSDTIGDSETITFDPGARLDCQLGYNFTKNWAAELEIGLAANQVKNSVFLGTDFMEVDWVELPIMVNVIYTQPLGRHFSAYVGGGLGGVFSDYSNEFGGTTESDSTFGFQALAGIKFAINERWDIGVGYIFLGTTDHDVGPGWDSNGNPTEFKSDGTMTHSVLLALTCKF
ncbi:MAG TPA: outer membrane beta-barrel protein [Candidatus Limnocylindrales bacterium]|nr:outer membrane beta-barrel protein [Candidatus Limnocylindrales bacterium]